MEGPKVKLVVINHKEPPMTPFGKLQREIYCCKVTRIGRFYPCNPCPQWGLVTMYRTNVAYWIWRLCSCCV